MDRGLALPARTCRAGRRRAADTRCPIYIAACTPGGFHGVFAADRISLGATPKRFLKLLEKCEGHE
ncbi:MAG: hypothetical protein Kow0026_12730 [Oricola sp.]